MDGADLSYTDLHIANLDGLRMKGANLKNCNLLGANLSEADLADTDFTNATLHGACLAYSNLKDCHFKGALFGGTHIQGVCLDQAIFSTLSACQIDFQSAKSFANCTFIQETTQQEIPFSLQPIHFPTTALKMIFFDQHLMIGNTIDTYQNWLNNSRKPLKNNNKTKKNYSENALDFFGNNKDFIMLLLTQSHGIRQSEVAI